MMANKNASISEKRYLVPFALVTSLFFMWGFARAILDVLNKHFQTELQISITQSSLIQVMTYLGYFLTAIPAGLCINRFGYRRGVVLGLLLFAIGSFLFVPSSTYNTLNGYLVALFVIACGLTFLETSANPYATELGPRDTATSRLNLAQSFNGLGSALAPVLVGGFLFSGQDADVSLPYVVMGVFVLLAALVFSRTSLPEISHDEEADIEHQSGLKNLRELAHNRIFRFGLLALLAYEVAEISINSYFVNFTTGMGWLSPSNASYILGLSLFIFMGGRFVGSWVMRRVAAERMLLWCGCGSVMSIALLLGGAWFGLFPAWMCILLLVVNYFCEAIMFPTIFALTVRGLGSLTKSASSILMMTPVGGCGFLLMALLADASGSLVIPFVVPLLGYIVVMLYARRLVRLS